MVCDIDYPVLDYADHKTLIFHHDFDFLSIILAKAGLTAPSI